ncbi:MAG: hypothetical protein ACRD88_17875, partial [Terriglobia bacterium]
MDISKRLPSRAELAPVYAVIVMMVYSWTILWFYYNLPGWLGFLNFGEVIGIFAYSMTTNFLESLAVLAGIVLCAVILPRRWFSDAFVARGAALAMLVLGLMMYIAKQFETKEYYPAELIRWSPALLAVAFVLVFLLGRVMFLRKAIEFFADRAIIFLYI